MTDETRDIVREWVAKAESDYRAASRESAVVEGASLDVVCFHAQQCIEKLFKAALTAHGEMPPKTHDLIWLDELLRKIEPQWTCSESDLRFLTRAAVHFRYPGYSAGTAEAADAIRMCNVLRAGLTKLIERLI